MRKTIGKQLAYVGRIHRYVEELIVKTSLIELDRKTVQRFVGDLGIVSSAKVHVHLVNPSVEDRIVNIHHLK